MKKVIALTLAAVLLLMMTASALAETTPILRMGGSFGFGVDSNGVIWGWGDNRLGQIGYERKALIGEPVQAAQGLDGREILDIQCGNENSLYLMKDGTVFASGTNSHGQLGNTSVQNHTNVPVQVTGLENIVAIDAGFGQCLALDAEGHVWAWGKNNVGQVGDGTRVAKAEPVMLELENIVQIGCGGKFSIAMDQDGVIYTWGENDYGQLGFKTRNAFCETPTALELADWNFVAVTAGGDNAYALDADGHVWAWGRNELYQCGTDEVGETNYTPVRAMIPDDVRITKIFAYNSHTMALAENGDLYLWGNTNSGQNGLGKKPLKSLPAVVMSDVADAQPGSLACLLMLKDGTVWGTGLNKYGQCGVRFSYNRKTMLSEWTYTGLNLNDATWERPEK